MSPPFLDFHISVLYWRERERESMSMGKKMKNAQKFLHSYKSPRYKVFV